MENSDLVCRLCLSFTSQDEAQILDTLSKDMLKELVPQINLEISDDPRVCQSCYKTMLQCYKFKTSYKKESTEAKVDKEQKDEGRQENKCEFCLTVLNEQAVDNCLSRKDEICEALRICLPERTTTSCTDPVSCTSCLEMLNNLLTFTNKCSHVENGLLKYCLNLGENIKEKVNLQDAVQSGLSNECGVSQRSANFQVDLDEEVKREINFESVDFQQIKTEEVHFKAESLETDGVHSFMEYNSSLTDPFATIKPQMSGNKCSYFMCQNSRRKNPVIKMFRFPVKNINRCNQWIANSGNAKLAGLSPDALKGQSICSEHFPAKFIRRNMKLPKDAIPFKYSEARKSSSLSLKLNVEGIVKQYPPSKKRKFDPDSCAIPSTSKDQPHILTKQDRA